MNTLSADLTRFSQTQRPLPGLLPNGSLDALALQMVASLRRLDYTRHLLNRDISPDRADPNSAMFDPERAAIWHMRNNRLDEAVWVLFLSIHFGKHRRHGWRRMRDVYSGLGAQTWTWALVSANVPAFRAWLQANRQNIGGAFGNHRKYESLNGLSANGTGETIASYVAWVGAGHDHAALFARLIQEGGNNPETIFDHFYKTMSVKRFGRLGKFDFLALIGRLGMVPIEPGKAYLDGATGPLAGARLLFGGSTDAVLSAALLEGYIAELDDVLQVGKQVMEDSLCNWQKSPTQFVHFIG